VQHPAVKSSPHEYAFASKGSEKWSLDAVMKGDTPWRAEEERHYIVEDVYSSAMW